MERNIIYQLEVVAKERNNQGKLAQFLLDYKGDFNDLKIRMICDELYVSIATATRLAKRLNLNGFNELRIYLMQERQSEKYLKNHNKDLTVDEYYEDIKESLNKTIYSIEPNNLIKISQKIAACENIDFYAVAGSNVILQDFAYKIERLNIPISVYGDNHLQHVKASNSKETTIAFALSYSGETKEVLEKLQLAKQRGAYTILMTSNLYLQLDYVDEFLHVKAKDLSRRTYSITSRIASLAILDLLYLKLLDLNHQQYEEILDKTRLQK